MVFMANNYSQAVYKENSIKFYPQVELNYHNLGVLTIYDIEKLLLEFIEDSYIQGYKYLLVITGKGKIIRPLVNKLLKFNEYVSQYNRAGHFNGQDGAIEITLK